MTTTPPKELELATDDGKVYFRLPYADISCGYRMVGLYRTGGNRITLFEDMQDQEIERAWLMLRSWRREREPY